MQTPSRCEVRKALLIVLLICPAAWPQQESGVAASQPSKPVLVISGGTLIDGTGAAPIPDSVVVIEGDRIVAVGPRATVKLPSKVDQRIDAKGQWVIPGLIDAHVHFFQSGGVYTRPDVIDLRSRVPYDQELAQIKQNLPNTFRRYLCSGVTSVVDVGGPMLNFEVRDLAAHTQLAPRVAVAGPLISTVASPQLDLGDPPIIKISTPDEARALVRRELAHKPDLVKVWYIVPPGTKPEDTFSVVKAAAEESHAHGVRLAVHATELATAKAAVAAGADILVHSVFDVPVTDEFIQMLKERHIIYTTTIVVLEGYAKVLTRHATLTDIDRACGDPQVIATWDDLKAIPEDDITRRAGGMSAGIPAAKANLKKLEDAGVIVAAGTDAGNIGTLHGPDIHREFELMSEAGLAPMQILVSATRNVALVFNPKPEFGTLEAGKLADIAILDADPLADIRNARKIHTIIKGGNVYAETDLVNKSATH